MDPIEQIQKRLRRLQPEIPAWAKAEQMEKSIPQKELWNYPADPGAVKKRKFKREAP